MADVNVNLFSNAPKFCQKNFSTSDVLTLPFISSILEQDENSSNIAKCGDPNKGVLMYKNLVHSLIRCGGKAIDMNWMEELFPMQNKTRVETKRFYNHFVCDPDMNIYVASNAQGTGPGAPFYVTILKANHGANGTASLPAIGYEFIDKDNGIWYTITDADTSVPFAHRFELTPRDGTVTGSIKANTAYLIGTASFVGGCQCGVVTNSLSSIGYSQEVNFLRIRKDWELCIDLLTGYQDKLQFAITYDINGNPVDGWDIKEAQDMRLGIRSLLNLAAFIGTPTTNASLISGAGATIDANYTGFYGMLPTLQYGGGNVYNYRSDLGFDWEVDGEPIMLYQDSRKKTSKFMALCGMLFQANMIDRTNKLVSRQNVGNNIWEAYRRTGMTVEKLALDSYKYNGFEIDLKKVDSWSDYRYFGSDKYNAMAIFLAQDGISENGRQLQPVEFYSQGTGKWTGDYEEHYLDFRNINKCNNIGGWAAQSVAMDTKCPNQHILVNPIKAA
ncbi:MAG: hypothetical protein ABI091_26790 [Ferruginibacter sp.]